MIKCEGVLYVAASETHPVITDYGVIMFFTHNVFKACQNRVGRRKLYVVTKVQSIKTAKKLNAGKNKVRLLMYSNINLG